jgi:hypothetical protein
MGLKRKKRLMPLAGQLAEDRAHAHYRWAERYHGYGDHKKAAAHFGRALDYSYDTTFGDGKKRRMEVNMEVEEYTKNKKKPRGVEPHAKVDIDGKWHREGCRVCPEQSDLNWYRENSSDNCYRLCTKHARDFLENGFVKEDLMCDSSDGIGIITKDLDKLGVGYDDRMEY